MKHNVLIIVVFLVCLCCFACRPATSNEVITSSADTIQKSTSESSVSFIDKVINEARSKGWENVAVSGVVDESLSLESMLFGNSNPEDSGTRQYLIMGCADINKCRVTMICAVTYKTQRSDWKLGTTFYYNKGSNTVSNDIIATNDSKLYEYLVNIPDSTSSGNNTFTSSGPSTSAQNWQSNSANAIINIKNELANKGWENIVVSNATADTDSLRYIVTGKVAGKYDNPITMIANFGFSMTSPEGKLDLISFFSNSGREMDSNEILASDDKYLYEYMYS